MKSPCKLSVLLPVRNEGVNTEIMLKILNAVTEIPHEILVIYDDLHDNDIEVVQRLQSRIPQARLVHNQLGKGVVNALKSGIQEATGEYILIFAVDEVGPVMALEDMLALMEEGCELVSCTRYAFGGQRLGGSWIGGILSKIANKLFHFITGSAFTDSTTGIKMFRKSLLDKITLEANPVGWAVVFELAIKAQLAGVKLGEVPIVSIDRLYGGVSTFKLGPWCAEYIKWFIWGVKRLRLSNNRQKVTVRLPTQWK